MVTSLYVFEVLCFLKKYKSTIEKNKQVHDHNTRTNMGLHIEPCNMNPYKNKVYLIWEFDCIIRYQLI